MNEARVETAKPDGARETAYRARNLPFLVKRLAKRLADLHPPHEAALLRRGTPRRDDDSPQLTADHSTPLVCRMGPICDSRRCP